VTKDRAVRVEARCVEMVGGRDAPTAVVVVDAGGVVSGWSEGGRLLLGWGPEEIVGRPVTGLLADPPSGFPEGRGTGSDPIGIVTLCHQDGSTVDAVVTAQPLGGAGGRALGHVVTTQRWGGRPVIADRAFEQCPLGVYDPELRFLWVNASACRVMAHSEEQVLGEKYRELFPELDDKAYTDQLSEVARTGEPARLVTVFRPLGSTHTNAWGTSMWPVRDTEGTVRAVANWGFDMSAEYWARQRLLVLNEASSSIGRTLDVTGTAEELARTPVPGFADLVTVDLFDECCAGTNRRRPPRSPPARPCCSPAPTRCLPTTSPTGASSPTPRRCRTPGSSPWTGWTRGAWGRPRSSPSWWSASWSPTPSGTASRR
jgi:PAS domain-containing protein